MYELNCPECKEEMIQTTSQAERDFDCTTFECMECGKKMLVYHKHDQPYTDVEDLIE